MLMLANPAREEKTPKWTRMSTNPGYLYDWKYFKINLR
jgi:hypothetical protein